MASKNKLSGYGQIGYNKPNQQEQSKSPHTSPQGGGGPGQPIQPHPAYGPYPPGQYGAAPVPYGNPYYGAPQITQPKLPQSQLTQPQLPQPQLPIPGHQPPHIAQPGTAPSQVMWMPRPYGVINCPPGLEYLTQINQLIMHQKVKLCDAESGAVFESRNKYEIKNKLGQRIYFAHEVSDDCMRQVCDQKRGFTMHIMDNAGQEVMRVNRPFKCCAGNFPWCAGIHCCTDEVEIEAPVGTVVGHVKQTKSKLAPKYHVLDAQGKVVLWIQGPNCICTTVDPAYICSCCGKEQDFLVFFGSDNVGRISAHLPDDEKQFQTTRVNFGVSFPMDLEVKMKAVMLGAVFLLDFMFFDGAYLRDDRYPP